MKKNPVERERESSGVRLHYPPTASGRDIFPTITSIQSSKIWLGNQEAFSGDFWIVEEVCDRG